MKNKSPNKMMQKTANLVQKTFSPSVSTTYEQVNHILTFGHDALWRRRAAIIGAGTAVAVSNASQNAAEDQYNAQYTSEMNAAISTAEAGITQAEQQATAIRSGAAVEAGSVMSAATIEANTLLGAAETDAAAVRTAAGVAREEAWGNVELMRTESNEELLRLQNQQTVYESKAKARAAASGGELTGSTAVYLDEMGLENTRQFDFLGSAFSTQQSTAITNLETTHDASLDYATAIYAGAQTEAIGIYGSAQTVANSIISGADIRGQALTNVAATQWESTMQTYTGPGHWANFGSPSDWALTI